MLRQNHVTTTATASAANSAVGLSLGGTINLATPGTADYVTFALYDETLDGPTRESQRDAGYAAVPAIPREANDVIVAHGDSITQGNSRSQTMSVEALWFNILMTNTANPFTWYNHGHGGWTVQQLLAVTPAVGAVTANPAGSLGVILFAGTNALAANRSGADVFDDIKLWAAAWRTAGATHIHVVDTIPRKATFSGGASAASFETERQVLNTLIPTGVGVYYDSASSPGTHPILGDPANCNGTYFLDQIHPNVLGNQILESVINAGTAAMRS